MHISVHVRVRRGPLEKARAKRDLAGGFTQPLAMSTAALRKISGVQAATATAWPRDCGPRGLRTPTD
jgi:hypothetical protein